MSTIRLPIGSWIGRPAPIAAASGSSTSVTLPSASGEPDRLLDRPLLHLGAHRGDRDQHARLGEARGDRRCSTTSSMRCVMSNSVIVPCAQRPDRDHVAGVAADQVPGLVAHREHFAGAAVQRDHRRLVEDDAVALAVDERVGRAEVDREVAPHQLPMTQWASPETSASFFQMGTSSFSARSPDGRPRTPRPGAAPSTRRRRSPRRPAGRRCDGASPPCGSASGRAARRRSRASRVDRELVPRLVGEAGHVAARRVVADGADEHARSRPRGVGDERPAPRPTESGSAATRTRIRLVVGHARPS